MKIEQPNMSEGKEQVPLPKEFAESAEEDLQKCEDEINNLREILVRLEADPVLNEMAINETQRQIMFCEATQEDIQAFLDVVLSGEDIVEYRQHEN